MKEMEIKTYSLGYIKEEQCWKGSVVIKNESTGSYYFTIKNGKFNYHMHTIKTLDKKITDRYQNVYEKLVRSKEGEELKAFISFYIEKLEEIKKQINEERITVEQEDCSESENNYHVQFSFHYLLFDLYKQKGSTGYEIEVSLPRVDNGGLYYDNDILYVDQFLGKWVNEVLWEYVKKISKHRLRLMHWV
jgi:hypothetical protein